MMEKGLIIVHTGDGKGKTTAALGLAIRAWGAGKRVLILQFIKGGQSYGELVALKKLAEDGRLEVRQCGKGFTRRGGDMEKHKLAAEAALREAKNEIMSGNWDLVILDEINYALNFGLVEKEKVLAILREKPEKLHLVLTGREAAPEVIELADLVTEMKKIKHPFDVGIKAQSGIEF